MVYMVVIIIIVLSIISALSYVGYKLYHRDKVPKGTPDIVDDIKESIKSRKRVKK